MVVQEMHDEFKITLDKVDSQAYPEFLDGEIDFFLNEAQIRLIKTRYGKNNLYRAGFEELQKRTDDLKGVVVSKFCEVSLVQHYNIIGDIVYRADLNSLFEDLELSQPSSSEYMLFVKGAAYTCKSNCCAWHKVKLVQQDDITTVAGDPFNKPAPERPIIFFEDGDIFVWAGKGTTINGFLVTFIKNPLKINLGTYGGLQQNCELSEHMHKEIVQLAVRIALENIEAPRQQTHEGLNVRNLE